MSDPIPMDFTSPRLIEEIDRPANEEQTTEPCSCSCKESRGEGEDESPQSTRDQNQISVYYDING